MDTRHASWTWLLTAAFSLLLLVGSLFFLQGHWRKVMDEAQENAARELALLVSLSREVLQEGHYQQAAQLLQDWGAGQGDVAALRLESAGGILIGEYRRASPAAENLRIDAPIQYGYTGQARLSLTKDLAPLRAHQDALRYQLGLGLAIVLVMLAALARLLALYRRESTNLQAEIARGEATRQALEESEQRYRIQVEHAPEAIVVLDVDNGHFVDANGNAARLLGMPREELLRKSPMELSAPVQPDGHDSAQVAEERIRETLNGATPVFEWVHRNAAGQDIPCEVRLVRLPATGRNLVRGSITDITARKQAEHALEENEQRFRQLFEQVATVAVQGYTPDGTLHYWNKASEELYGYSKEEALGRNLLDLVIPPAGREAFRGALSKMAETGQALPAEELRLMRKDGSPVPVFSSHVVLQTKGVGTELYCLDVDLSERMRAEEALLRDREQQTVLRAMLEEVLKGDALVDTLGRCMDRLLAVSWLSLLPKGGVFLMDEDGQSLRLTVSCNLAPQIMSLCQRVPIGCCHCGRAAASREMQFSHCVDHHHEISYPGMVEHGHYNLPLISEGQVLGVMVLYLPHGFARDPAKEQFLDAVANTLAGYIRRKQSDEALRLHRDQLEDMVAERTAKLREQATILDQIHDSVVTTDLNGQVTGWNRGAERLFGYTAAEAIGQHIAFVYPEDQLQVLRDHVIQPVQARGQHETEVIMLHKDGRRFEVHLSLSMLNDSQGNPVGMVGYSLDITERKLIQQRVIAAKEEAERASRAKSEFLSRMSHELRTPLNAILGFGQLLEMDLRDGEQADNVREILHAGHHLLELINEVLDLARIEAGKLSVSLEPVPIAPLLQECLTLIRPMAEARGIRLKEAGRDCGEQVLADRTRFKQVLLNLLSNAVKYNREGGTVDIACVVEGEAVQVRISDTGAGLAPEQQARLFTAFERLDADKAAIEGTGIGLALSKRLMEAMMGEIGVESTPGQGSTFWLRLAAGHALPYAGHGLNDAENRPLPELQEGLNWTK